MTASNIQTTGTADGRCDLGSGTWSSNTASNAASTAAACATACETTTVAALLVDPDTSASSGGALTSANNGGATAANFANGAQTTAWCGAYSFDNAEATATSKCKLSLGGATGVQTADAAEGSSKCGKYDDAALGTFVTNQDSVQSSWAAVTAQMHADIVT
jgi:hypothetical protein